MRAIAIIAASLLSGHHHVQPTTPGIAYIRTAIPCGPSVSLNGDPSHVRCVRGHLVVTHLHYGHAQTQFGRMRRLVAYNADGHLSGWVDWRRVSLPDHLAVGVFNEHEFTMTWYSS